MKGDRPPTNPPPPPPAPLPESLARVTLPAEAESILRAFLATHPHHPEALHRLGLSLVFQNRFADALGPLSRSAELQPNAVPVRLHLSRTLQSMGRHADAITVLRQVVALEPNHGETLFTLGATLALLGGHEMALEPLTRAAELAPDNADWQVALARSLILAKRHDDAIRILESNLIRHPGHTETLLYLVQCQQSLCRWDHLYERVTAVCAALDKAPGTIVADPWVMQSLVDSAEQLQWYTRPMAQITMAKAVATGVRPFVHTRPKRRKRIRLGYVSPDFRPHPVASLVAPIFEQHDRSHFEVIAYSLAAAAESPLRTRIRDGADRFVDFRGRSSLNIAQTIFDDRVDILIDLAGYTAGAQTEIAAFRPAPIQAGYLGYPGTLAGNFLDYILVDRFVLPESVAAFFSEQPVYLPNSYLTGGKDDQTIPAPPEREACGLPEDAFVFCCFNTTYKILPKLFTVWMQLLREVPHSVLWLAEPAPEARANLLHEAGAQGVDSSRIIFAPRCPNVADHLARVTLGDLFLDTFPYNAHATANDMLWVGVPVLTLAGHTFPSRVAGSQLTTIGLPELVTHSLDEYRDRALELAHNPEILKKLRWRLADVRQHTPLFDSVRLTRHLEQAFEMMWERYLDGKPPAPLTVANPLP
ncbi:MAG: tetratricopeptide repeat protein [Nitrospirota bacterium]|nr:tetratricopeptide repeat protein [Nitrospirota bacterium]